MVVTGQKQKSSHLFFRGSLNKIQSLGRDRIFHLLCELPLPQLKSFNPSLFEELKYYNLFK